MEENQQQSPVQGDIQEPLMIDNPSQHQNDEQHNKSNDDIEKKEELDSYQNFCHNCGQFCGFARTWLPIPFCCFDYPWKQVQQSYEGLIERFGSYQRTVKPGLVFVNPITEIIDYINIKTRIRDLEKQLVLTKDNLQLQIDASVYFKVVNPRKAKYRVDNVDEAVKFQTFSTLKNVAGQYTLQELLEQRDQVNESLQQMIVEHAGNWGVKVEKVFIKDIILSPQLQASLSSAAKEKRLAQSKIISAQADVEAAKLMKDAADILNSTAAMQIRYFETIQHISKNPNGKILFLPLDDNKS